MIYETLFSVFNLLALLFWLAILFAPSWRWTQKLVLSGAGSLLFAVIYVVLLGPAFSQGAGGMTSLALLSESFSEPALLLLGWVHYLAFDLFVGVWILRDARSLGLGHWKIIPSLLLTFMLGPTGLLVYFLTRSLVQREAMSLLD